MKLLDVLLAVVIVAILASIAGPRLAAAKRSIVERWEAVNIAHHERLDYLASGALEDPRGHHTTEADTRDSLLYFTTLDFRR